ncbi:UDP-glucuronosyltransferase 2A1 [Eufriesea mexicana]|uniref:UDP-glucuronosyltransferase 2B31-like n=1 Tax=Eufriesea mexicana TaxID=516756 RepID=UPI00083C4266|nr:PREDICTED: UDP-glucuronosyltransferase 2B31-like [Eufriesea mexicana]OAD59649.1 UDP-glucuronosyltransferase 2A1 [Eufriesea mexicana]
MSLIISICVCLYLMKTVHSSTLTAPPQSAVVIAFEDIYDLSLLANTLSDQGIDATLIIPAFSKDEVYETLIDVEVLTVEVNVEESAYPERRAIQICEAFIKDEQIAKNIQKIQPTFSVFPAVRHDGCLLPWVEIIESIPVIVTRNREEELYVFEYTGAALPVQSAGFWTRLWASTTRRSTFSTVRDEYTVYALQIAKKYLPHTNLNIDNLYTDVRLILWDADVILRSDFAPLTQLIVEVGCHHCRGSYSLKGDLHKGLIEYRLGTIAVLLDENYDTLIKELAQKLPQGREGQAVVWKNKKWQKSNDVLPENLFVQSNIDRQDLIGYGRTRVVLSHCADTELLEAAFHGTPVICFPRNSYESRNAARAVQLGFAHSTEEMGISSNEEIVNTVNQIHETADYRENARKVSLAIRDRINPAVDRLIYWLRYMARTKDRNFDFLTPTSSVKTLNEDLQFFLGLFVGLIIGIFSAIGCMLARYLVISKRTQRSKGRYTR